MTEPLPSPDAALLRHAPATVHGRFLVSASAAPGPAGWLVGFHGYAQTAEWFLEPLRRSVGPRHWHAVSVQGLHPFYAARTEEVVANWMTRQDRELAIASNVRYVDAVLDGLEGEFGPPRAIVFAGFSQGVAMAFRAGMLGRRTCAAIVSSGGDLPPEFESGPPRAWPRVALATGDADAWYTPDHAARDTERIRAQGGEARTVVFAGGHVWSDAVVDAVAAELAACGGPGAA